jgi:hypothetical protein
MCGRRLWRRREKELHNGVRLFFTHNSLNAPAGSQRSAAQRTLAGMNFRAAYGRSREVALTKVKATSGSELNL